MADEQHLEILNQGVEVWNRWREENPDVSPDLSGAYLWWTNLAWADFSGANLSGANLELANLSDADLSEANLSDANLSDANLSGANLRRANLRDATLGEADLRRVDLSDANLMGVGLSDANLMGADLRDVNLSGAHLSGAHLRRAHLRRAHLSGADLRWAELFEADLTGADFSDANLSGADLSGVNLRDAYLRGADLSEANLREASLVNTDLSGTDLKGCSVFGISAWKLDLEGANQSDLVISAYGEPVITVDNLEVAQFMYLLLHNERIRHIIDTITSKVVLILGRFTPERKRTLDAMRDELRERDYLPILFDFEKPASRDITETISTLAHMARFVIADITDARSVSAELERIVPGLPSVPVQPLIASSDYEYGMFEHIRQYPWVLDTYQYDSLEELLDALKERVIDPAEDKAKELTGK